MIGEKSSDVGIVNAGGRGCRLGKRRMVMEKQGRERNNSEQRRKCNNIPNQSELVKAVTDQEARAGQQEYMEQLMEYMWHEE